MWNNLFFITAHASQAHWRCKAAVSRMHRLSVGNVSRARTIMDSVKSVLRIIEAVATSPEIGVSDLSRQLQQPKTTVQRGLMTLHEAGWIRPTNEPRRRWKITSKLFMLSRSAETEARLRRAALPIMQTLRDETQETTHLMVREERHLVLIERVELAARAAYRARSRFALAAARVRQRQGLPRPSVRARAGGLPERQAHRADRELQDRSGGDPPRSRSRSENSATPPTSANSICMCTRSQRP